MNPDGRQSTKHYKLAVQPNRAGKSRRLRSYLPTTINFPLTPALSPPRRGRGGTFACARPDWVSLSPAEGERAGVGGAADAKIAKNGARTASSARIVIRGR